MKKSQKEAFAANTANLNDQDKKKLKLEVFERLLDKVANDENDFIEEKLDGVIIKIPSSAQDQALKRSFRKELKSVQKQVKTAFGYVEKGSLKEMYIGAFMAIGTAIGVALSSGAGEPSGTGQGAGMGVIVGLMVGIFYGESKEKKAEEQGLIY